MSLLQPSIRATLSRGICGARVAQIVLLSAFFILSQALAGTRPKEFDASEDHVHVSARRSGDSILVTLRIDPGYHINANPASSEYLIPTNIAFEGIAPERVAYPPALPFQPAFSPEPINVYEGSVVISASFPPGMLDRMRDLSFTVTVQACTEQICLPPDDIPATATW